MFTYREKLYMLKTLKQNKAKRLFGLRKLPPEHQALVDKLEQMVRNEQVNKAHL
ncbi:hypothetical protein SAMN04487969_11697 [Paenibacillus algorifonticola]|uniref:Uncharacterized protein n=2 Tax=Paenibacillus TaxID=44249 RepID=A0A1I2GK21_9BACL|nr:hypothetical protein SAMN04487969_11697 [Paenibacillus algorifonticola]